MAASQAPSGFLLEDAGPDQLIHAIRAVANGDALLAPSVTRRLIDRFARKRRPPARSTAALDRLTPRELEVLKLVAQGLSNAEIAARFTVEDTTIKTHVSRLLAKLGLRDRVQAVILAYELGLVDACGTEGPVRPPVILHRIAGAPMHGLCRRETPSRRKNPPSQSRAR